MTISRSLNFSIFQSSSNQDDIEELGDEVLDDYDEDDYDWGKLIYTGFPKKKVSSLFKKR